MAKNGPGLGSTSRKRVGRIRRGFSATTMERLSDPFNRPFSPEEIARMSHDTKVETVKMVTTLAESNVPSVWQRLLAWLRK